MKYVIDIDGTICHEVYFTDNSGKKDYANHIPIPTRIKKVNTLYEFVEKCKPSKDLNYATSICYLAAHNILGSDILKLDNFIKDYSEIVPSENEKKLNGNEIQKILKDRKIKLIKEELEKDLD